MDSDISNSQQTSTAPVTLESVVTDYQTPLLRYAARILNNHATAQDVVQNVLIKLAQAWETDVKPSGQLKSWLYRATHNEAVDHIRGESRRADLHEESAHSGQWAVDSKQGESAEEDRMAVVLRHLGALHPRERQIVLLRLEEGLSYTEISAITGRTEGNVGNILHHAIRKLGESIKKNKSGGLGEASLPPESEKVGRGRWTRRLDQFFAAVSSGELFGVRWLATALSWTPNSSIAEKLESHFAKATQDRQAPALQIQNAARSQVESVWLFLGIPS